MRQLQLYCHVQPRAVLKLAHTLSNSLALIPPPVGSHYLELPVPVSAKLSFVEPGRRWAHSLSPSKAAGISYQGTVKTSMKMLKTSGGL